MSQEQQEDEMIDLDDADFPDVQFHFDETDLNLNPKPTPKSSVEKSLHQHTHGKAPAQTSANNPARYSAGTHPILNTPPKPIPTISVAAEDDYELDLPQPRRGK